MGQSNMAGRGDAEQAPQVPAGIAYEFKSISQPDRLLPLCEPFGLGEDNPCLLYTSCTPMRIRPR